ncbi:NAD(+) synthase [Synergistaceae bacterium OttesenSCG-928-I11]|nr:NAD(+) synthase [Synergistaceae bacterium OttesenSCG-928-I11]
MAEIYRDPAEIAGFLERWVRDRLNDACAAGAVLGLSGGVDSSALAALLRRVCGRDCMLAVIMPCHSMPVDEEDARLVAGALDIPVEKIDLTGVYDAFVREAESSHGELSAMAKANIKPRLRMTTLYAVAQSKNYLVFGGGNRDELMFGYFTKHGDSGVDALPFGDLLKGEVFALARYLGVPDRIVDKPPTAGLWEGQTDEREMGVTYDDLDRYLATGEAAPETAERIESAMARSAHKRSMPKIAEIPKK